MDANTVGVALRQPEQPAPDDAADGMKGRQMMTLKPNPQDFIYRRYTRSLELVLRVYKHAEVVRFDSVYDLGNYLGCDDTRLVIRILRQLSDRYHLLVTFDDRGVTITNGSLKGN